VLSDVFDHTSVCISSPLLINCFQDPGGGEERNNCVLNLPLTLSASLFLYPMSDNRADEGAHRMNINGTMFQQDAA